MEVRKVFKRFYDNPLNPDGTEKPNELLGEFFVVHQLWEDSYAEQFIGMKTDPEDTRIFLVEGKEISGTNGGSRYDVTELPDLYLKGFEPKENG